MTDEQFVKRVAEVIAASPGRGGLFYIAWMVMLEFKKADL